MWCWRRLEKISWTDHVRNEEVLLRVKEQRNILHEIRKRKANWIGHILRRNCLLQRVTEGKIKGGIEVTERRGRRCRKLLDDLKERRGYSHLKEEALGRTVWRARFGRGFGPVVRQITKWVNGCRFLLLDADPTRSSGRLVSHGCWDKRADRKWPLMCVLWNEDYVRSRNGSPSVAVMLWPCRWWAKTHHRCRRYPENKVESHGGTFICCLGIIITRPRFLAVPYSPELYWSRKCRVSVS